MRRVLFVCVHNGARSQMAEAFLNSLGGDAFKAESAGIEPGTLNPFAVAVMAELGIDIAGNAVKSVSSLLAAGRRFDTVITVCDGASAERCPVVPGISERLHWPFPDPAALTGSAEERLAGTREVRDTIRSAITTFIAENRP